ncbi:MAG TPA: DUF480 domain-containing protein [Isosphaeraceae bacterium]|jgi:hypothetical protein|nr:DUF480 domain-containing protein [Isosphaeraceae bacterium]
MSEPMPEAERTWVPLAPGERRVLGVLVEKAKTTPEYYPLTISALVAGCNQKSNRDPITNYDADDAEEILQTLRQKGAVVRIEGSGRVVRWKHTLYDWLGMKNHPVEMAVITELLLRGPQTEGDLRARASRMEPIADLPALQTVLEGLAARGMVVQLSPPGQKRGVIVTHGLYPPEELERVRQEFARSGYVEPDEVPTRVAKTEAAPSGLSAEVAGLRAELSAMKERVDALAAELQALKTALGV